MATAKKKINFYESEEGAWVKQSLTVMASDAAYNTNASYSANINDYPDHQIPFVDKHMRYLSTHPSTNAQQYVSNLRLMTRIR